MKVKTYKKIVLTFMLLLSVVFLGAIGYSVYSIYLYETAPVVEGRIESLGTTWSGGTWTCTVSYEWQGKEYRPEIWYHVTTNVGDRLFVHINESKPDVPYSTFWWKLVIAAAGVLWVGNIIVCVIKITNATRGISL